ncbi:MAG TPA: endolytic transglycosylase MltG [Herpetosiphonaceae bacterium]|nr:endolytic transglycosylase MltG [Herpetosiphonaceae bacterium]
MNRLLRALMLLVILGSLVVAGVSYWLLAEIRRPVDPQSTQTVDFEVQPEQSAADVAANLKDLNLIRQPLLFNLMVRERKAGDKLKVGTYKLSPAMTTGQIVSALQVSSGGGDKQFRTIEGMRLEEVAKVIVDAGLAPSTDAFLAVAKNAAPFKAKHERLKSIPAGQSLEGYLFPNTYRIKANASVSEVIDKMLTDGFDANYATFEQQVIVQNRSIHEIVTMASIVQREAASEDEMPHLAYTLWNRLKPEHVGETAGLLGADPTVQYLLGYSQEQKTWWRNNLTQSELETDNPYNTRKKPGLPPGPIDSPGLAALRAAARPGPQRPDGTEGTQDLYFVVKCGQKGHAFAATYQDFLKLQQNYQNCPQ